MPQDVIAFPTPQEQADDVILKAIFRRQCKVSLAVIAMARQLYETRSAWIGGNTIPWEGLSVLRRASYMREVEDLVKKAKGEE